MAGFRRDGHKYDFIPQRRSMDKANQVKRNWLVAKAILKNRNKGLWSLFETENQDGDDVDWIQCDTCSMWFHQSCVEVDLTTEKFYCKFCLPIQVAVV